MPFLIDPNGNRIEPSWSAFYLDKLLDVTTEIPQICSCNCDSNSDSNSLDQPFNQSLTTYQNAQTELIKPELEQIKALLRKVKVKSDQMMHLQSEMLRMQATMIKMQLEPKDEKMDELQCYGRPKRKTMKCLNCN
ncbi:hypothetical protein BCR41DRAFT_426528 [Lobosporangium transversale]|uniref:Uncharacterized protein n=1 Tax=Lobosporangium transversale TaxID=64571 RepID=A0A1Y2G6R0_9FUNG|nr:hypothetical protein BCR41DRAFT_426528 [Lobosporangium transversale]ORY98429.1 hypothetical protein BCR41DRAFT_426528 [Lobosporangium transversale]|eukprot:XP_021875800.1 hypothetical protein BCR41DRAFT_426528 [Lobosporangium transversale]